MTASPTVLLYDGACGLCASSVQFILARERRDSLRFAPLQGTLAAAIRARHPEIDGVDSMVWVERAGEPDERVHVRSAAVLRAAQYVGGVWGVATVGWLVPRTVRDAAYDFVARHRHRIFGAEQCYLPPAAVRARFLE